MSRSRVSLRAIVSVLVALGLMLPIQTGGAAASRYDFWKGASGDFVLKWSATDIIVHKRGQSAEPVLSFKAVAQAEWQKLVKSVPPQALRMEMSYRILSLVGPILSVEEAHYCECGGAHPTASKRFRAIDLRKSRPNRPGLVVLNEVFPEQEIRTALAADKLVSKALAESAIPQPKPLSELLRALEFKSVRVGECSFYFSDDLLSSFAFYDAAKDKVAVRLSLSHETEVCRGQLTQLGLMLPAPTAVQKDLAAAKIRRGGLLMISLGKTERGAETVFRFSIGAR